MVLGITENHINDNSTINHNRNNNTMRPIPSFYTKTCKCWRCCFTFITPMSLPISSWIYNSKNNNCHNRNIIWPQWSMSMVMLKDTIIAELYSQQKHISTGSSMLLSINSLIEAEWRTYAQVNYPSLVQIMACRLVGTKPLSRPILEYC